MDVPNWVNPDTVPKRVPVDLSVLVFVLTIVAVENAVDVDFVVSRSETVIVDVLNAVCVIDVTVDVTLVVPVLICVTNTVPIVVRVFLDVKRKVPAPESV